MNMKYDSNGDAFFALNKLVGTFWIAFCGASARQVQVLSLFGGSRDDAEHSKAVNLVERLLCICGNTTVKN